MADILFKLDVDTSNLDASVDKSLKEIRSMGKAVGASVNDINKAFNKLGKELVKNVGADKALITLNKKMKEQSSEVDRLRKEYDELDAKMDEFAKKGGKSKDFADIEQFKKTRAELKEAQKQYDQLSAAVTGATEQSQLFSKTVNGIVYEGSTARNVFMQMNAALQKMEQEGKTASVEYRNLQKAVADMSDSIGDSKQAVSRLASDTAKLDAVLGGVQAAAGGFSVFTGAVEMFGASTDDAAEAQKKLQSAIAITTGLQSIQNVFQKQSAVMVGLTTIQTKALAKAEAYERLIKIKGTEATKGATIAQKAFNLVAKANPYVVLAVALVTVVGALAAFAFGSNKAIKEQKKAAEASKRWSDYVKTLISNYDMLTKAERDAAKHAVDLAEAEGKSKRDVIKLQEKQLELEKKLAKETPRTYKTTLEQAEDGSWITKEHDYVEDLEDNRKELAELNDKIEKAKIALGNKKKAKLEDGTKINADYIAALETERDALQTYVDAGDAYIEMQNQMKVSAAKLAEAKRELAIAEDQANTAAKRTTQDLQTGLMDDKYEQQKKQTTDNYNRQIEDIKTRLANEKNLTETEREELNNQIELLEQTRDKELEQMQREHLNERVRAEEDAKNRIIEIQDELAEQQQDTLQKQFDTLAREREQRLRELTEQEESWIKEQGGLIDAEGHYTDTSKLTEQQQEYLKQAREAISKLYGDGINTFGTKLENSIFESYASGLQKAIREQDRLTEEAAWLQSRGRDTTEVKRQQNEQALAYMQSEEQEINPEFERWVGSLVNFTSEKLEGMLLNAEAYLTKIESDKDTTKEELIEARAIIAALQKQIKEAKADPLKKVDTTKLKQFNKVLGDAASGFEALGQTGNEAFDKIMQGISDVLGSVQSIIGNIQVLVESSIKGMETTADEGAKAVKTVEKASVILAIIGAALSLAMKIKNMIADDSKQKALEESIKQCEKLRAAFADLHRQMLLDTSGNDTVFGDNMYSNLKQFTSGIEELTDSLEENRQTVRGLAENYYDFTAEKGGFFQIGYAITDHGLQADKEKYHGIATGINEVADALANYKINIDDRGKFRKWFGETFMGKGDQMSSIAADYERKMGETLDLIGESEEETYKRLQAFRDSDYFEKNADKDLKASLDEMLKNYESYFEAKGEIASVYKNWFGGMSEAFAESIKVGFTDGAKAGRQNFKEQVNGMISDMFLQLTVGQAMEDILKEASAEISNMQLAGASPAELANKAAETADKMLEKYDTSLAAYEELQDQLEQRGFGIKDSIDGTLSGAIKGASQESIDLLSGYCNAVRIQQVDGINIMREQLISLSGIERNTLNTNTILGSFKSSVENLLTADNVRASGAVLN